MVRLSSPYVCWVLGYFGCERKTTTTTNRTRLKTVDLIDFQLDSSPTKQEKKRKNGLTRPALLCTILQWTGVEGRDPDAHRVSRPRAPALKEAGPAGPSLKAGGRRGARPICRRALPRDTAVSSHGRRSSPRYCI